jgi:hypothetical protein
VRSRPAGSRLRSTAGPDLDLGAGRGRMMAGQHLLSLPVTNGNNGHDLSVRVRQPKAVGLSPGVALDYIRGPGLRGRDGLFLGTQDTGFPLDRNCSLQPIDCEQRALLPPTIATARFVRRRKELGAMATKQDVRTIQRKNRADLVYTSIDPVIRACAACPRGLYGR